MTLAEIKSAVDEGKTVHCGNQAYKVIRDGDRYLIKYLYGDYCIGLTWTDGVTLNGKPEEFFLGEP